MKTKKLVLAAILLVILCLPLIIPACGEDGDVPSPVVSGDAAASGSDGVDVDLTALSGTMAYAEVYNIVTYPGDYIGKTRLK